MTPASDTSRKRKSKSKKASETKLKVAELFAGVGGFRLGLERRKRFEVAWSNQWEPGSDRRQFASRCYQRHFAGKGLHFNRDIESLLDDAESRVVNLPHVDLVVGGFPCQDYSVAKALNQSQGIKGKKGVLWWQIHRLLLLQRKRGKLPSGLLLENVDRLLKSPASQPGRDFAVMLRSLTQLGYTVEWRVVNAADYGFPQRRRRIFMAAYIEKGVALNPTERLLTDGVLARSLRCVASSEQQPVRVGLHTQLQELSRKFSKGADTSPFLNCGVAKGRSAWTLKVQTAYQGKAVPLADILLDASQVPPDYFIDESSVDEWKRLKGSKKIPRVNKKSGVSYVFAEGRIPFPDDTSVPGRTILTSEGGASPSRTRHVVACGKRYRRLLPVELERLNGFPDDWTNSGMSDTQRAFCMGNALVVGVVERIAPHLAAKLSRLKSL